MPKRVLQEKLDAIVKVVGQFADGATLEQVNTDLGVDISRRTLQRHLSGLVKAGRISREGKARASRYRLTGKPALKIDSSKYAYPVQQVKSPEPVKIDDWGMVDDVVDWDNGPYYPLLSAKAEAIKACVRSPIQEREPVPYNPGFLRAYRPNETFYLPGEIRRQLMEMGNSTNEVRPVGTYIRQVFNRLLIDLSWNSSRLEGNTYSLLETERLLELGENAEGKDAKETQMILNHKAAIELLVEQAAETGFNRYTILNLHALLSENLLPDPAASGRLRSIEVGIRGSSFYPLAVPQQIDECFQQILDTVTAIRDPFEQAFFVMVHLPYLQPFEDVNKRVSRLAANISLIRGNLCPLSFVDVPERAYVDGILGVYERNQVELLRDVFVWAYKRSCARYSAVRQALGEPDPFRMRYRGIIAGTVSMIVKEKITQKAATAYIRRQAREHITGPDQKQFIDVVEAEVMGLHEGNIARYRLRPSEYQVWREIWK